MIFIAVSAYCSSGFRCNNGRCISTYRICNHIDECGDNSDEINCGQFCDKLGVNYVLIVLISTLLVTIIALASHRALYNTINDYIATVILW